MPSNALPVLSVLFLFAGCLASDTARTERFSGEPITWQAPRIGQHLSLLNSGDLRGRPAAGAGAARAARYLAERLGETGYQPVLAGEYRTTQSIPMWTLEGSAMSVTGRDTIRFSAGTDYLVDGLSGAASVRIPRGVRVGSSGIFGPVVVAASSDGLTAEDVDGAMLVILTDSVRLGSGPPLRSDVPIVFPLTSFRDRLRWPPTPQERRVGGRASRVLPDVRVDVRKASYRAAPVVQVAGMLAGRSIASRDSLVVLLAPYDGFGVQGDRSWTNGDDLGIAAAALLEVAVRSGIVQRDWHIFDRTVMIAFVSGTHGGVEGVESGMTPVATPGAAAWLDVLPWEKSQVSDVILVSDAPCSGNCVPADASGAQRTGESTWPRVVSIAPARSDTSLIAGRLDAAPFGVLPRDELLRGNGLDAATRETMDLAERVYDQLLAAAAGRN